jgi:hypothetical protein
MTTQDKRTILQVFFKPCRKKGTCVARCFMVFGEYLIQMFV